MVRTIREIPRFLGKLFLGLSFVTRALGDTVLDVEEMAPFFAPNNLADPHLNLAGAIMLLFAGSLSMLAVGYVVDSTRDDDRSSEGARVKTKFLKPEG
jgi:hypothetical protein